MSRRPGGELSTRPLHFIWIVDCSGSMKANGKIQALNHAIREAIPHMKQVADDNPNAEVLIRALKFSSGAQWLTAQPMPVSNFSWMDVQADGVTDLGKALSMIADQLKIPPMSDRALPPVLALISDGQPTDDFNTGLRALMGEQWGKKAIRIAIGIGEDSDSETLQKFIGNPEIQPLQANNADSLVNYIRWVSTVVLQATSAPTRQTNAESPQSSNVIIPTLAQSDTTAGDVW